MFKKLTALFLFFYFFLFITPCFANNILFEDDFSHGDNQWERLKGNWYIENEEYVTHINQKNTASYTITGNPNWKNYIIEAKILMNKGVDLGIWFRATDVRNKYSLNPRFEGVSDSPNLRLWKRFNDKASLLIEKPFNFKLNKWYSVKIIIENFNFKVWIDNIKIIDITDNNPPQLLNKGKIGLQGWSGNLNEIMGRFDNIKVTEIPDEKDPVIIIPGNGASWNWLMLDFGYKAPGSWGAFPLGLKRHFYDPYYKNLEDTLLQAGYKNSGENQNLFTFYYNYMGPMETAPSATTFKLHEFIDEKIPNGKKAVIIGHSQGGLIARLMLQTFNNNKVKKIITLGSPHKGAIDAYKAWEGGIVKPPLNIIINSLKLINKEYYHQADVIKDYAPSAKEMIPVFDFLKLLNNNNNYQIFSWDKIKAKNQWLAEINQHLNQGIKNFITTIYGQLNYPATEEWLHLSSQHTRERLLGIWRDGHPLFSETEKSSQGDSTVLTKSAKIDGTETILLDNTNHQQLINSSQGIEKILDLLNINNAQPVINQHKKPKSFLTFFVHSPARIKVTAPNGEIGFQSTNSLPGAFYNEEHNFILIPNADDGDYQIQLTGIGNGQYNLNLGQTTENEDKWQNVNGHISLGEIQQITTHFNHNAPLSENILKDDTGKMFLTLAQQGLENLKTYVQENFSSSLPKRRIIYSLNKAINKIKRALNYLKTGKYYLASRQTFSALVSCYRLRRTINSYAKREKINLKNQAYVNNQLYEISLLLSQAWKNLYKQTGKKINPNLVKRYQKAIKRFANKMEQILKSKPENKALGAAFNFANDEYQKAEAQMQSDSSSAYIHFVLARLLYLESYYLAK